MSTNCYSPLTHPLQEMKPMRPTPRIYVACLASHNSGVLHGAWIDATDADDMAKAIAVMLRGSSYPSAEEYAIHDYGGFPSKLSECEPLTTVAAWADLAEHYGPALVQAACEAASVSSPEEVGDVLTDRYLGTYDSLEDFAQEYVEGGYDLEAMGRLARYIDYAAFGRDMELGGEISTVSIGGTLYVFSGC